MKVKHKETLVYYDSPQLFLASDRSNAQYLCLLVECNEELDKYLCVQISPGHLEKFYKGKMDLRSIYETSGNRFYVNIDGDLQKEIQLILLHKLPEEWLPAPGFFLAPEEYIGQEGVEEISAI